MHASFPMYDRPELVDAHDRLWSLVRHELEEQRIEAPELLSHDVEDLFAHWSSPDLVVSQTCAMPYRVALRDSVVLVGTPDYGVEGCPPGYYRSVFVVRSDDRRTSLVDLLAGRLAFNDRLSHSGYNAPRLHFEPSRRWFADEVETGSHRDSAAFVARGTADIASLDAVSWRLMQRHDPFAQRLRVLAVTAPAPGLPYIAGGSVDGERVAASIERAIERLSDGDRTTLGIRGFVEIAESEYLSLSTPDY